MPAIPQRARPTKIFLIGLLSFLGVLILAAFQYGENNGLNSMPYAFCAKFCVAAGSPLLFISDQCGVAYVVLTARNGVPLPENILNLIGVPGIAVKGTTLDANGVKTLAVENVRP